MKITADKIKKFIIEGVNNPNDKDLTLYNQLYDNEWDIKDISTIGYKNLKTLQDECVMKYFSEKEQLVEELQHIETAILNIDNKIKIINEKIMKVAELLEAKLEKENNEKH